MSSNQSVGVYGYVFPTIWCAKTYFGASEMFTGVGVLVEVIFDGIELTSDRNPNRTGFLIDES